MTTSTSVRARFPGDGRIDFDTVTLGPVAEGEVRLRVDVCALCGSDKRLLRSGSTVVPGHEIGGTVVEVGAGVDLPTGTRAIVYIPVFCGTCRRCVAGRTNQCLRLTQLIGWQRDGGFAEHVDVPARCLLPVPDDVPLTTAVLGLDTVGTAAHALRLWQRAQPDGVDRALVVGAGPLGLGVISVARAFGIGAVDAADPHEGRLATAVALGARAAEDLESENQYDLVIEVSGVTAARETAQRVVAPGGAVIALGESDQPYTMPATPRWRRTDLFTIRSFYFPTSEVEANWDLLRNSGAALRDRLTVPLALADLPEAFARFVAGDYLKPCIVSEDAR
ncbi:Threonine dehydrogenase [Micromonospora pallida]|uniref:Threonine dehydrogenase n=1 Tax=Micromonospora pallida TaxID=145854 RepID=A0A1C6ST37_9ACTN|nr:alcohol dehydrogenase catalytic domain-containing protein [Micromonospora pallida]SCL32423.1 Threonine dehydrogenase [Micromonospora pallida]